METERSFLNLLYVRCFHQHTVLQFVAGTSHMSHTHSGLILQRLKDIDITVLALWLE